MKDKSQEHISSNPENPTVDKAHDPAMSGEPREGLGTRIAARFREIGLQRHEAIEELRSGDCRNPFEE